MKTLQFYGWTSILLFIAGLFTTFHRLNYLIALTCLVSFIWFFSTKYQKFTKYGILAIILGIFAALYSKGPIHDSDMVTERLQEDTVSCRLEQYKVILEALPNFIYKGMGDYTNSDYYNLMDKANMVRTVEGAGTENWHREPFAVHTGYLEVGILYGVLAMIVFTAVLFSMITYFKKLMGRELSYNLVPFYAAFIWALANISNGVGNFGLYFALLTAMLMGATISLQRKQ